MVLAKVLNCSAFQQEQPSFGKTLSLKDGGVRASLLADQMGSGQECKQALEASPCRQRSLVHHRASAWGP